MEIPTTDAELRDARLDADSRARPALPRRGAV